MSCENVISIYYPGFEHTRALALCEFQETFQNFLYEVIAFESHISIASFFINLFHFIILTQKSMRSSSVNIIMAAVAIFDILSLFVQLKLVTIWSIITFSGCSLLNSYGSILIDMYINKLKDYSRRCSTWLCFSIALIRILVIRYPFSPTFQKLSLPKTSMFVILSVSLGSLPIIIFNLFESRIRPQENTRPCNPNDTTSYALVYTDLFTQNNGLLVKISTASNAIVSHIIPCVLFPIVTFFLVLEFRKAKKSRSVLVSSKEDTNSRTTKLVVFMTLFFLIAEFPFGVTQAAMWLYSDVLGFRIFITTVNSLFSMIFAANTMSHFFICMFMSSQYRDTVKCLLSCGSLSPKIRVVNTINNSPRRIITTI